MGWGRSAWMWCGVGLWLAALSVQAEPLVRVQGESRIELGVTQMSTNVLISGALRDELGNPLSGRPLEVVARAVDASRPPLRQTLPTDEQGRFELVLTDRERDYSLLATFGGDETHRGVRVERRLERHRSDVRLELRIPNRGVLDLDGEDIEVEVVAESDASGASIQMRLSNERDETLATGTTDGSGRLSLTVDPSILGPPGPGLVRIESAADATRAEAQTESRVVRRQRLGLSMEADATMFEAGAPIQLRGQVTTANGPRGGDPVGLYADGIHAETVIADEQGQFDVQLWVAAKPGIVRLKARVEGDATHPATERALDVRIGPASPLPWTWLLGAVGVAAVCLLWLGGRRLQPATGEPDVPGEPQVVSQVQQARRHSRRPQQTTISGTVSDLRDGKPLANTAVVVRSPAGSEVANLCTDQTGRFASAELPPGTFQMVVSAPGYVPTRAEVAIPHRGEWTQFQVRLESLRVRALAPFRRLALQMLPSSRVWGVWTDREVLGFARQQAGQLADLSELTDQVERACYGSPGPTEADVQAIEREAQAVEAQMRHVP